MVLLIEKSSLMSFDLFFNFFYLKSCSTVEYQHQAINSFHSGTEIKISKN